MIVVVQVRFCLPGGLSGAWLLVAAQLARRLKASADGVAGSAAGGAVTRVHQEVADLLCVHGPSGFAVIPRMCT